MRVEGIHIPQMIDIIALFSSILADCNAIQDYLLSITGARSVPRVFINGKCIGGGSEVRSLNDSGKLVPMLKDAGAL